MFKLNSNINQLYVTYRIGEEFFALSSDLVRNIFDYNKAWSDINEERNIVINNQKVEVVDLRLIMGRANIENNSGTSVIVLEIRHSNLQYIGIVVDEVVSLIDVDYNKIEAPFEINKVYIADFIEGILKSNGQIIKIINISNLLSIAYKIKISHLNDEEKMVLGC